MSHNFEFVKRVGRGSFGNVSLYTRKLNGKNVIIKKISFDSFTSEAECKKIENEVNIIAKFNHLNIVQYFESFVENDSMFIVMEYASGGNLHDFLKARGENNFLQEEKIENEVNIIAKFNHLNIVQYFESFVENDSMFIVMEYASGGNLHDFLKARGENNFLQEEEVLHLFCQLVAGIHHIHEHHVLHRDLKTHNIMLNHNQRILKIGDFGISKSLGSKGQAVTVVGTPCYLSPEMYQSKPYDQKSDIWALGCILYEMLTLQKAFESETFVGLMRKIMMGKTEPIPSRYSQSIISLTQSMLNVYPERRPDIYQIIGNTAIFPTLFRLFCDFGMAPKRG